MRGRISRLIIVAAVLGVAIATSPALPVSRGSLTGVPTSAWRTCDTVPADPFYVFTVANGGSNPGDFTARTLTVSAGVVSTATSHIVQEVGVVLPQLGAIGFGSIAPALANTYNFDGTAFARVQLSSGNFLLVFTQSNDIAYSAIAALNGASVTSVIGTLCDSGVLANERGFLLMSDCSIWAFADDKPVGGSENGIWSLVAGSGGVSGTGCAAPAFTNSVSGVPESIVGLGLGAIGSVYLSDDGQRIYFKRASVGDENKLFFITVGDFTTNPASVSIDFITLGGPFGTTANEHGSSHGAYGANAFTILEPSGAIFAGSTLTGKDVQVTPSLLPAGAAVRAAVATNELGTVVYLFNSDGVDNILAATFADLADAATLNECLNEGGSTNMCSVGATCTDTIPGYTCACDTGYTDDSVGDAGTICTDDNECALGTHNCGHLDWCENTPGTFTCTCPVGFVGDPLLAIGSGGCEDFNECLLPEDNTCAVLGGACTNTDGAYTCACVSGYSGDGVTCADVDECEVGGAGDLQCVTNSANSACVNDVGSFHCECSSGYTDDVAPPFPGGACININECLLNPCAAVGSSCTDTDGSHTCECIAGYKGDGVACEEIDECTDLVFTHNCAAEGSTCTNTVGSFTCACNSPLYDDVSTGDAGTICDLNECNALEGSPCHADAACTNTLGSYECACNSGFTDDSAGAGTLCTDINECTLGTADCSPYAAVCTNTPGSFTCACDFGDGSGVDLSPDPLLPGRFCDDIDECVVGNIGDTTCIVNAVDATCENEPGSYHCQCFEGFTDAGGTGTACLDIDECALDTDNCAVDAICTNTAPGFTCACPAGFTGDGLTCVEDNECAGDGSGHNCHTTANCANSPLGSFTCSCPVGASGDPTALVGEPGCTDDNECALGTHSCAEIGSTCTDTIGGFNCDCNAGYADSDLGGPSQGFVCTEINECVDDPNACHVTADCANSPAGSHTCTCPSGFSGDPAFGTAGCVDIDECALGTSCVSSANSGVCVNAPVGSVTCSCEPGYGGDGTLLGTGCTELNECIGEGDGNTCVADTPSTGGKCENLPLGSHTCSCQTGFSGDGSTTGTGCTDDNECLDEGAGRLCSTANTECTNTDGSHTCACDVGYEGDALLAGSSCTDIDECATPGVTCVDPLVGGTCSNAPAGSVTCGCQVGYTGDGSLLSGGTGCTPLNECGAGNGGCHSFATCVDKTPHLDQITHECECFPNYFGDGVSCTALDTCALNATTIVSAGCTTGDPTTCTAYSPLSDSGDLSFSCLANGVDCEYTFAADPCPDPNDSCSSAAGVSTCTCDAGYFRNTQTGVCDDILECADPLLNNCDPNSSCTDIPGSFTCECNIGYEGTGEVCTLRDECALNPCGLNTECTNFYTAEPFYTCACLAGYEGDLVTLQTADCTDINECLNVTACSGTGTCVNVPGSASCTCGTGFTANGLECVMTSSPAPIDWTAVLAAGLTEIVLDCAVCTVSLATIPPSLASTLTFRMVNPDQELTLDCEASSLSSSATPMFELTGLPAASLVLTNCPVLEATSVLVSPPLPATFIIQDTNIFGDPDLDLTATTRLETHGSTLKGNIIGLPDSPPLPPPVPS